MRIVQHKGNKAILIGKTIYIERTKDFFVQEDRENEDSFVNAIKIRESMGDRLK